MSQTPSQARPASDLLDRILGRRPSAGGPRRAAAALVPGADVVQCFRPMRDYLSAISLPMVVFGRQNRGRVTFTLSRLREGLDEEVVLRHIEEAKDLVHEEPVD